MENIQSILASKPQFKKTSRGASYGWQIRGLEIASALGCANDRRLVGQLMRACRDSYGVVERVMSFMSDVRGVRDPVRLFWWKYWQVKRAIKGVEGHKKSEPTL